MAININTLFADIIDTPEQRQQKLLQQGMMQGQLLSSGLQGRARAAAPLAQMAGQLGVQRNEDLRRAVQPMLGLDPRTTGERVGEQIAGLDMSKPEDMLQAARAIESIDPLRAAALRQAASQQKVQNEDRAKQVRLQELQIEAAEQEGKDRTEQVALRESNALRYRAIGMPEADVQAYVSGAITPIQMAQLQSDYLSARGASAPKIAAMSPFAGETLIQASAYIDENTAATNLLKEKEVGEGILSSRYSWAQDNKYTKQDILDEAAVIRAYADNKMMYDEAIDIAITTLPKGGVRSLNNFDETTTRRIRTQLGYSASNPESQGEVNLGRTNAATQEGDNGLGLAVDLDIANKADAAYEIFQRRLAQAPASPSSANLNAADPSMPMSNAAYLSNTFDKIGGFFNGLTPQRPDLSQANALDQIVNAAQRITRVEVPDNLSPQAKKEAATFNDYMKAAEDLNFPVLPTIAKQLKNLPAISGAMVKTFEAITRTLSTRENAQAALDQGLQNTLDATANVVGSLVRAQTNTRDQGEDILQLIESAQTNIREINSQLSKVPPAIRKEMNQASNALLNLVIEYKKRYNLPTPPQR
tara:strand:- start:3006 stop:4769 length:1764 start_codon:yes stop_codon:yes gene_type:complete